jgi:hypothetical protein
MFKRTAKRAGIVGSTMHHMRHGFVTALLDEGVGAHVVKELAGHADLATPSATRMRWPSASAPRSGSSTGSTRRSRSTAAAGEPGHACRARRTAPAVLVTTR